MEARIFPFLVNVLHYIILACEDSILIFRAAQLL